MFSTYKFLLVWFVKCIFVVSVTQRNLLFTIFTGGFGGQAKW